MMCDHPPTGPINRGKPNDCRANQEGRIVAVDAGKAERAGRRPASGSKREYETRESATPIHHEVPGGVFAMV